MKNVFLDTNILIDYVLNRPGGNDHGEKDRWHHLKSSRKMKIFDE